MTDKKELNYDELEKVTGGRAQGTSLRSHGDYVDNKDAKNHIGKNFYVVSNDDEDAWALCQLEFVNDVVVTVFHLGVKETCNHGTIKIGDVHFRCGKTVKVKASAVTLFLE